MTIDPSFIACFGAAHWDHIGQARPGFAGADRPGSIQVRPGGVATNVAMALASNGARVELLTAIGNDEDGRRLLAALDDCGVGTALAVTLNTLPTGRYIAVEDEEGELVSAVADCRIVEDLSTDAFRTSAVADANYWFLESNLPSPVLEHLAATTERPPLVANPVSPARTERLRSILHAIDILYCNKAEAEALCRLSFTNAGEAAQALLQQGINRAVVTEGPGTVCDASATGIFFATPDTRGFTSATGAGDAFMARHLIAVISGATQPDALRAALAIDTPPQGREAG